MTSKSSLEDLTLIELGTQIESAIELYGDPIEKSPHETFPEVLRYVFSPDENHEIVINSWKGIVHEVIYWFEEPSPDEDLVFIARHYGQDHEWNELNPGYLYYRDDEQVRLWCSAIPAIGVGTIGYFKAQSKATAAQQNAAGQPASRIESK
jgi:hypothetical protein